jgi:hypothetical protein
MIGPTVERSTGDGELAGEAAALTTGALLDGTTLGGDELGASVVDADDAAGDEAAGALLATVAAWWDPEHAESKRHAAMAGANHCGRRRRAR